MNRKRFWITILSTCLLLALAAAAALASAGDTKDYPEGGAAGQSYNAPTQDSLSARPYAEGQAAIINESTQPDESSARSAEGLAQGGSLENPASGLTAERSYAEGQGGIQYDALSPEAPNATTIRYMFSGVADDGAKGASGKIATSILCTNIGTVNTTLEVQLFQFNGTFIHGSILNGVPPLTSYTFSTQGTAIYFDDVIFGSGGTVTINQGYAVVKTDNAPVVCTAEVLDPTGYPPAYISSLEIFQP